MTSPTIEPAGQQARHRDALAEAQFASVVDPDLTPSEDETPEDSEGREDNDNVLQLETVQSAIGVSIGQQQTRLTSPTTPAAEKAAALDDTDGGVLFDGWQSHPGTEPATPPAQEQGELPRLPSPWRANSNPKFQHVDAGDHRTALRNSLASGSRRRAMSGGSATETLKKYMPSFNLPSMSRSSTLLNFSLPNFSISSLDNARSRHAGPQGQRKRISISNSSRGTGIAQYDGSQVSKPSTYPPQSRSPSQLQHPSTEPIMQQPFVEEPVEELAEEPVESSDSDMPTPVGEMERRPASHLRRSNSEGSLLMHRQKSFASSLGDDTRFEHVQEQVNSRLKAIKDSWQDSNFKLPSLPSIPNFGFGSRDDLFRSNRNGNPSPRVTNSNATATNHRVSFMAISNSSSRGPSMKLSKAKDSSTNVPGMSSAAASSHPYFTQALKEITGDIVVLGGYRGSILRSAEPPNRQLWVPIKVGLNLRKVDLELGLNPEDEETEEERIIPAGMLTHIGPVDIAKRLFKRLRASENAKKGDLRVHNYGYDWRLSPHILSRRLIAYLRKLPCNQPGVPPEKRGAIIIAHSLGGLITRHAINQHPELVAGVIYAGVPQGCVNILGPLRNGDDVLLSSRVLTAQVNFTIRTSFALLPLDGKCFINKHTKEEYPVDFFDVNTWSEYRLSPCIAPPLPHPNATAPPLTSVSGILNAMSQALPSLPGRKNSNTMPRTNINASSTSGITNNNSNSNSSANSNSAAAPRQDHTSPVRDAAANAADKVAEGSAQTSGMAPQMSTHPHKSLGQNATTSSGPSNPATTVTIPRDKALAYLSRTLSDIKTFKEELAHRPEHTTNNAYPPIALIYGKSTPTVYGAKVESREAIKRADAYDELAFASGDGVVLARAAMVPEGYSVVRGGVVSSDRGHVTLLGDLEAVGRCLVGVLEGRRKGVGLGRGKEKSGKTESGAQGLGLGVLGVRDGAEKSI